MPAGHCSRGLSITVVSYISSGALSVALSERPTAPKTVLQLSFQHILLIALTYAVACLSWRGVVLRHGGRFGNRSLRTRWLLSSSIAGKCQSSNEQSRSNERNTSAPEETPGQISGLHLSSASQTQVCKRTNVRTHECVSSSKERRSDS